jgi:hypothetical protein
MPPDPKDVLALSEEKVATAVNYVGYYGFLNLLAVGLLIYLARN